MNFIENTQRNSLVGLSFRYQAAAFVKHPSKGRRWKCHVSIWQCVEKEKMWVLCISDVHTRDMVKPVLGGTVEGIRIAAHAQRGFDNATKDELRQLLRDEFDKKLTWWEGDDA